MRQDVAMSCHEGLRGYQDDATVFCMSPEDRTPRVPQGPIGAYVISNLEQLRKARRLSYQDLSARLREIGRPIPALGLSRIEKGTRRVDADDLVALAIALGVNPAALLLPRNVAPESAVALTERQQVTAREAWEWSAGRSPLWDGGRFTNSAEDRQDWQVVADFAGHARPKWAPMPDAMPGAIAAQVDAQQPVVAAVVTSAEGILVGRRNDGSPPWTFIAGEVEPGEQPGDAAVREVKEEAGLLVEAAPRVLGGRLHPRTGRWMIYIAATPTHGTSIFVGDEAELAEVRWVTLAEADQLLPGMFGPVREYLARKLGEVAR